ncbi:hypothetical protein AAEX37_02505 [Oligella sp. MSHR50489EDL]
MQQFRQVAPHEIDFTSGERALNIPNSPHKNKWKTKA